MSAGPPFPVVPPNTVSLKQVRASTWVSVGFIGPRRITGFFNHKPFTPIAIENIGSFVTTATNPEPALWSRLGEEILLLIDLVIVPDFVVGPVETITISGFPNAAAMGSVYTEMAQGVQDTTYELVRLEIDPSINPSQLVIRDPTNTLFISGEEVRITGSLTYKLQK